MALRPAFRVGSEPYRLTMSNDVEGLKGLFSKGLGSPNMCNYISGSSLLVVSMSAYLEEYFYLHAARRSAQRSL